MEGLAQHAWLISLLAGIALFFLSAKGLLRLARQSHRWTKGAEPPKRAPWQQLALAFFFILCLVSGAALLMGQSSAAGVHAALLGMLIFLRSRAL